MIVSGRLALDQAAHAAASARLAARLVELDERRRAAELAVEALLSSWRGDAAAHFSSRWQDWDSSAHEVIDQLSALLGSVDLVRQELEEADATSVMVPRQLRGRLG